MGGALPRKLSGLITKTENSNGFDKAVIVNRPQNFTKTFRQN